MSKSLTQLFLRRDHIDGYAITGHLYQIDDDPATAWYITSVSSSGEIHDYWLTGDTFRAVTLHMFHPATGMNHIEIHEIIDDLSAAERSAVHTATQKWKVEYREILLGEAS